MHKFLSKITSALTAITIVGSNLMPALVYAANYVPEAEANEDIIFDAKLNNEYSYSANIDEQLSLDINLAIINNGYIRDGQITIQDNNYKIGDIESDEISTESTNFAKINENTIELNQINSQEQINVSLPISFEKSDLMEANYFERDSKVLLNATFVNENGEEEQLSKDINLHLKWNIDVEGKITQELKRYLKYENKTLVSFLVTSGIVDNKIPVTEKTVQMLVPFINGIEPSKIIVSGNQSNYSYQNQVLVINKKYEENGRVDWNSNDEYLVTYIYDTQVDEVNLETLTVMSAKTVLETNVEARTDKLAYRSQETIGTLIQTDITGDNEINKGYMYTNLHRSNDKLETPFKANYKVNIGLADFVDEIQIKENLSEYGTITKKITVDGNEFTKILGENGSIRVINSNDEELGVLNKDNLQLEVNQYGLRLVTSKPVQEGDLNISLEKIINPNLSYTKEILSQVSTLNNSIDVIGIFQGQEISNNHITKTINLIEPESKATISVSRDNLSTVVTNEDVVITATLERNDISDSLYSDPQMLITLPNQVTNVTLKDAKLIYEDELTPVDFRMVGKQIFLKLQGTQTKYSNIPNANGTVVRIVADIQLDNLAVNAKENIVLQYTNQDRNELKSTEIPLNIVAPTGFVTSNMGALSQAITAINEDETLEIAVHDKEKTIKLGGTIVSNLQENATGLMILGRVPSQDTSLANTNSDSTGSTFSTSLASSIEVSGIDADIYYSDNGIANYDLQNQENGWSLEPKETSKSYLIVAKSDIAPAQKVTFNYNVNVPRNLDYENKSVSSYAVYYDNKAENGISKNAVLAKSINIATENIPVIKTEITAKDNNNEEEIKNGDKVNVGKTVKYLIHATNTGKKTAENVLVKVEVPESKSLHVELVNESDDSYVNNSNILTTTIDKIEPNESKNIEVTVYVPAWIDRDMKYYLRTEISAENMLENSVALFENVTTEGTLELELSSVRDNESVLLDSDIDYYVIVKNYNKDDLNNVSVKVNVPKYLEILSYEGGNFDEKSRMLTYNIDSIDSSKVYTLKAKVAYSDEPSQEVTLSATATFDGMEKEIKSNKYTKIVNDTKGFTATLSSNISGKMLDTDTVEYYINVKNDSKRIAKINISETLPTELKLISYSVKNEDTTYTQNNIGTVASVVEDLKPGDTLKVTVVAKPYILDTVGQIKEIENKAFITVNNMNLDVNTLHQSIEGTSNFNTSDINNFEEEQEDIYMISGRVWYDINYNSKQDESEEGFSNIQVTLYNVETGNVAKDNNGKEISTYTNENGEYRFDSLNKGQYIIVANYDKENFELANYKLNNLSQNEDCDFITAQNGATSNVITVSEGNVYNIDLGLSNRKSFKVALKSSISKINIIDGKAVKSYDYNLENINLQLNKNNNSTLVIEYKIEVLNEGNIEGYVTKIENYISQGMQFISELNEDWYIDKTGNVINTSIANKVIHPGESQEVKLILVKDVDQNFNDLVHNTVEIKETYNKYGITNNTMGLSERKAKSSDIVITENKNQVAKIIAISLGIIVLITLLGYGVYKLTNR